MNAARFAQALRGAIVRLAGEEPPKPGGLFTTAIEWHRSRDRMLTKKDWRALGTAERQRAFTVANVAQLDIINDVWKAMDKAVDQGTTFEDFKKEVGEKLIREWKGTVKNPAHRLETIFRTNVQVAYGAGRWRAAKDAVKTHPFWQLAVVRDNRTSDTCLGVAGIVLPADDEWWKTNVPPRHFNCRSTIRSLRKREAERIRGDREKAGQPNAPGGSKAQEGFGDEPATPEQPKSQTPGETKPTGPQNSGTAPAQRSKAPLADVGEKKLKGAPPALAEEAKSKFEEFDLELQEGVHVEHVDARGLSDEERQEVLSSFRVKPILDHLAKHPPARVSFPREVVRSDGTPVPSAHGATRLGSIQVRWPRLPKSWNDGRVPDSNNTFSNTGTTELDAVKITFAHEIGHVVWNTAPRIRAAVDSAFAKKMAAVKAHPGAPPDGQHISIRSLASEKEYFSECVAAYNADRRYLRHADPIGYRMMRTVLGLLRKS